MTFESLNELTLKIHAQAGEQIFTKAGAFIGGESFGGKNYQFEKVLLGPQGNPVAAALGQLTRRFTGENLPLMKVKCSGECVTYYANNEQHVTVIPLAQGETLSVESENLLAFTDSCKYSVRFLAQGIISQKGLATSTLTGVGPNALVAVLSEGNPIVLTNQRTGSTLTADPDAIVCWTGADPQFKLDLSWKNLIGQASGESYMFEWNQPTTIVIQPNERTSGVDVSMDGHRTGNRPTTQANAGVNVGNDRTSQAIGNFVNNLFN
ncbi:MAG: AIM24 family protein [Lachnospiraceae bacterium]